MAEENINNTENNNTDNYKQLEDKFNDLLKVVSQLTARIEEGQQSLIQPEPIETPIDEDKAFRDWFENK